MEERETGCGRMLQAGGLTWRDLLYESSASLHSAMCVDVHTPVPIANVAFTTSGLEYGVG